MEYKFDPFWFQNLTPQNHKWNSLPSSKYNCVAFATGKEDKRWWPNKKGYKWFFPINNNNPSEDLNEFVNGFASDGYKVCLNSDPEKGFEKIAIYATGPDDNLQIEHVAIQIEDGKWASKMGLHDDDIIHDTLEAVGGRSYGRVVKCMKRERR